MSSFLDELYKAVIIEHSRHPHHFGEIPDAQFHARGSNPLCGDEIQVELRLGQDGRISAIGFTGHGCAISQSSASLMTDAVSGKSPDEAMELMKRFVEMVTAPQEAEPDPSLGDLQAMAGVRRFHARVKCATLAWHTLEAALKREAEAAVEEGSC